MFSIDVGANQLRGSSYKWVRKGRVQIVFPRRYTAFMRATRILDQPIIQPGMDDRIGTNIKIARQAVVASIILGQPRSLEKPE